MKKIFTISQLQKFLVKKIIEKSKGTLCVNVSRIQSYSYPWFIECNKFFSSEYKIRIVLVYNARS